MDIQSLHCVKHYNTQVALVDRVPPPCGKPFAKFEPAKCAWSVYKLNLSAALDIRVDSMNGGASGVAFVRHG